MWFLFDRDFVSHRPCPLSVSIPTSLQPMLSGVSSPNLLTLSDAQSLQHCNFIGFILLDLWAAEGKAINTPPHLPSACSRTAQILQIRGKRAVCIFSILMRIAVFTLGDRPSVCSSPVCVLKIQPSHFLKESPVLCLPN